MYTLLTSFSPSPPLSTHTFRSRTSHVIHFLHSSPILLVGLLKSKCIQSKTKCSPVSAPLIHQLHTSLSAFLHQPKKKGIPTPTACPPPSHASCAPMRKCRGQVRLQRTFFLFSRQDIGFKLGVAKTSSRPA